VLTDIDRLKRFLNKDDGGEDGLLTDILGGVSARMERWIGQPINEQQFDKEMHLSAGYATLVTHYGPITEIHEIDENGTVLTTSDWRLADHRTIVRIDSSANPQRWVGQVLVTYRAGYLQTPEDLQHACVMQCAFEYQQSGIGGARLGLTSNSPESGDGVGYQPLEFLQTTTDAMQPYRAVT
jgi:hypothetical protein